MAIDFSGAGNWDQAPVAPMKPKPMPSDAPKVGHEMSLLLHRRHTIK